MTDIRLLREIFISQDRSLLRSSNVLGVATPFPKKETSLSAVLVNNIPFGKERLAVRILLSSW